MKSIAVLPGDGIGIEVMKACVETWNLIKNCDAVLVGVITSKPKHEAEQE